MDTDNAPVQRSGSILLAATPIGDTNDASARLIRALAEADLVAAEDTRRLLKLASRLGVRINGDIKSLHEHNENERVEKLLHRAEDGERVLIVSDAGMPTISDPGYRVVTEAAKRGIPVSALPGPSAVLTALSVSGLPTDRFTFEGFIPRKHGERERRLEELKEEPRTMVFFDSPKRIHENLTDMANTFGGARKAVLCRELTKTHEEIIRADLNHLIYATRDDVKGELTLVVAGADPSDKDAEDYVAKVISLTEGGMKLKAAAKLVSEETGVRKNELYRAALARRPE